MAWHLPETYCVWGALLCCGDTGIWSGAFLKDTNALSLISKTGFWAVEGRGSADSGMSMLSGSEVRMSTLEQRQTENHSWRRQLLDATWKTTGICEW